MARESKKVRDEKRFGRPERLADLVHETPWGTSGEPGGFELPLIERFVAGIASSTKVCADNVLSYYNDACEPGKVWNWSTLPSLRLPFPSLFVESSVTGRYLVQTTRMGVLFTEIAPEYLFNHHLEKQSDRDDSSVLDILRQHRAECRSVVEFKACMNDDKKSMYPFFGWMLFGEDNRLLSPPFFSFDLTIAFTEGERQTLSWYVLFPMALAISFMNCKNVRITPVDPPLLLNRERRKAGKREFVRYHTINIEPMKAVLRSEGGVESNGLARALHICRGHFATLTRNNKGVALEKPTVYFREAHVRGHSPAGIVVSDYRVSPPTQEQAR